MRYWTLELIFGVKTLGDRINVFLSDQDIKFPRETLWNSIECVYPHSHIET